MAQDVDDSLGHPTLGNIPENQALEEKSSGAEWTSAQPEGSRNESNDHARSTELLHRGSNHDRDTYLQSSGVPQTSEGFNVEDAEGVRRFGFKPRTIPGMCA